MKLSFGTFALAALAGSLFVGKVKAQPAKALSSAELQGHKLAWNLCQSRPAKNMTNTGVLKIRRADGKRVEIPIEFTISVTESNWQAIYRTRKTNASSSHKISGRDFVSVLKIVHADDQPTRYLVSNANSSTADTNQFHSLTSRQLLRPFASSDFWLCDLGLQFFHWPEQKVLPNPTHLKRGRSYTLLESTNPHPAPNGYSRVKSWIDKETGGILEAEAYDAQGKLLKVFEPKSFEKVNGQWELQEMEIRNVQTDSQTRIEFDLN